MSVIKIFVTHTPNKNDYLVGNPLMVDVIAGGDYQTKKTPENMVMDNTGVNISKKNKSYCELTTQYWAWKNVEADYYGFCHYRRFLTLMNETNGEDESDRGQIISPVLNKYTAEKYNLLNESGMREFIEKFDVILPKKQNIKILNTPLGKQKNVYNHFAAHDRLFMNAGDLKLLMNILENDYPEYYLDAKEYMNNSKFWGFNCFILKKELFFELCEFEFEVLEKLEKMVDSHEYNKQMSRIYGFMGEILSCIYFHHIQKTKKNIRAAESRLVYFEYTDKIEPLTPMEKADASVIINLDKIPPFLILPLLNKLTEESKLRRDIIIAHHNVSQDFLKRYAELGKNKENVEIKFLNYEIVEKTLNERKVYIEDVRILLPWILNKYDTILYLNWNTWIKDDIYDVFNYNIEDKSLVGALDLLRIGKVFDVNPKYEKYLKAHSKIKELDNLINTDILLMNVKNIRKRHSCEKLLKSNIIKDGLTYQERINELYEKDKGLLPQSMNYYYTEDIEEKRIISQIPLRILNEYNAADEKIITYNPQTMWNLNGTKFCADYWNEIRKYEYYNLFLEHFINRNRGMQVIRKHGIIIGGLMCIKDHGLRYTLAYSLKKFKK